MLMLLLAMARHVSDTELVNRFKEGDRGAFSEIVTRYQDRVFSLSMRWMGDRQVAEEVAQEVFLALFRSLERFRGEAQLSTWIYRVVVNHCKNRRQYRQRRKMDQHEGLDGDRQEDQPARQLPSRGPGADAGVHRSEAREQLHLALERLDEQQRQIVILRDVQELSYEEISEILELPRGTVKSRLHRARTQLAAALARHIGVEDVL